MDNNIFYDLLFKGIDNPKDVTRDSLEIILNRITDLHNAMGQSFEYLVDIISTLMNNPGQLKPSKPASKSGVSEDEAQALRNEIMGLGDELREVKDRAMQLEKESKEKDKMIQELQRKFEEANNRQSDNVMREQDPMSEEDIPKEEAREKEEMVSSFRRRLGEFNNKVNNDERLEVEEEPEEAKDEMEENNGLNLYKFKKTFRKMKSNESESEAINSGGAPFLAALNGKRNSDLSLGRSSQMKLDEDANLNSLLNNFIGDKGSPLRGFSSNKFTAVQKKENDGSQSDNVFPSGKIFNSYQINKDKDKNSKNNNSGKSDLFGQNLSFKQVGLTEKSNTKSTEAGKTGSGPGLIQKMLNGKNKKKKGGLESLLQSQDANEEDDNNNKANGIGVNYLSFKEVLFKRKSDQGNAHDFE